MSELKRGDEVWVIDWRSYRIVQGAVLATEGGDDCGDVTIDVGRQKNVWTYIRENAFATEASALAILRENLLGEIDRSHLRLDYLKARLAECRPDGPDEEAVPLGGPCPVSELATA